MVDTNCPWTPIEARAHALRLKPYDLHWLEEPIFPPEDFRALAALMTYNDIYRMLAVMAMLVIPSFLLLRKTRGASAPAH